MGILKRWSKETFTEEDAGVAFGCRIKCLNFGEAPGFLTKLASFFELREEMLPAKEGDAPPKLTAAQVQGLYAAIPVEFVEDVFKRYVKDVVDLKDEDDKPITTGEQLFEIGSQRLALQVLFRIQRVAAGLSEQEGKASPSQPGPITAPTPTAGESAAAPTVLEVGT